MAQPADDFVRRNELRLYHVLVFICNHHLVKHLLQKSNDVQVIVLNFFPRGILRYISLQLGLC